MKLRLWLSAALLLSESLWAQIKMPQQAFQAETKDYDRGTYAAIDFPVSLFAPALKQAEEVAGGPLRTRGEAHLTILTPPEYMRIEPKIRKVLLQEMKEAMKVDGQIKPLCIGKGSA